MGEHHPAAVFLILFSIAVVFLCSFLLIYNVCSIALTQEMQAFGLLNVIGTPHKQMRRMIVIQSMLLFMLIATLYDYMIAYTESKMKAGSTVTKKWLP